MKIIFCIYVQFCAYLVIIQIIHFVHNFIHKLPTFYGSILCVSIWLHFVPKYLIYKNNVLVKDFKKG